MNKKNNEMRNKNSKNTQKQNNKKKSIIRKSCIINVMNINNNNNQNNKKIKIIPRKIIKVKDKKTNNPIKSNNKSKRKSFFPDISNNSKINLKAQKTRHNSVIYNLKTQDKKEANIKNNINKKTVYNDSELNYLPYEEALIIDKRTFIQYYLSLINLKQQIIFSFYTYKDYNSKSIKISLFVFSFALNYTVTALFFSESNLHKIFKDNGKFNIIYQIPKIIYSMIISGIINTIINYFSLTEKSIINFKNEKKDKKITNKNKEEFIKCLTNKIVIYFILNYLFLFLFWYYISCFCLVYKNTQIYLIKDTSICFSLGLLYPFGLCLLPAVFRIQALKSKNKKKEIFYKIGKILQLI